jgi:hypothetical protein
LRQSKLAIHSGAGSASQIARIGTLPPFVPDMPNGNFCPKPTFGDRPAAIAEEPKLGRLLPVRFKAAMVSKRTIWHGEVTGEQIYARIKELAQSVIKA